MKTRLTPVYVSSMIQPYKPMIGRSNIHGSSKRAGEGESPAARRYANGPMRA